MSAEVVAAEKEVLKAFPMDSKVTLTGLSAVEYNGKPGIVKGELTKEGRQQVLVGKKFLGLKPTNLFYAVRPVEALSMQELKYILKEEKDSINFAGMDVSDLRRTVRAMEPSTAFGYLASANAKAAIVKRQVQDQQQAQQKKQHAATMRSQADQLTQLSPDQLRQQARMMRSMPPDQIRRMNPQLAGMSDAQIHAAAAQMEQMADNPEMVKMAANQVKNMSPAELQRVQADQQRAAGGGGAAAPDAAAAGYGTRTASAPARGNNLDTMTPDQLKNQAEMMRNMEPDQIRRLNPQLASLSDAQIASTVQQMDMMASNPAMFEMAKSQMKGLSPEDIAKMQAGGPGGAMQMPAAGSDMDPAKLMESMDGKQLKSMMGMVKDNPEMMKNLGMDEAQVQKAMKMFDGMDEKQLDAAMGMLKGVSSATAPVRKAYSTVNGWCGGHLVKVVGFIMFLYVGLIIYFRFVVAGGASTIDTLQEAVPIMQEEPPSAGSEF
eukprot:CAMPEP_0119003800 /NCGR_PEP_ID=MMETSP1176-20130426/773_1 /TAXON_ID=265551 /ORGANISM="Synedropsis recta cf, Strain CCMP1620" /LENGTH=490 /DNA_ID=CAMNT_0006955431 /DNA_START=19 /DNA_END=1491 /DNA_ORIENTATION=+